MLFHWLDDANILEPRQAGTSSVVVRIVKPENRATGPIDRDTAFKIGRASIIKDELACIRKRGLLGLLEDEEAQRLMKLPVPGASGDDMLVTRRDALERFRRDFGAKTGGKKVGPEKIAPEYHPRFLKVQKAYHDLIDGGPLDRL